MSWAAEFIADNSGKFVGNAARFATKVEAENYALDLMMRWTAVIERRVVESEESVNYKFVSGGLVMINRST